MLENPFSVSSLFKSNHISVCLIQISTKIPCEQLVPFRESYVVFEAIPGVLGRSVNFNITDTSIKSARVSRLLVSCDYDEINLFDPFLLFIMKQIYLLIQLFDIKLFVPLI